MLINCKECGLQISDKAIMCPHCGYPIQPEKISRRTRSLKRRRLPNGFGQISEIKGKNLRKPFRAMVTVGKTPEGKPICKPLKPETYFSTYNDAYAALIEYNKNPYSMDSDMICKDLFEKWIEHYKTKVVNTSSAGRFYNAWEYCTSVYGVKVSELRARNIKYCMYEGVREVSKGVLRTAEPNMQYQIKSMFNMMLDYALEYELVDKNVARTFKIPKEVTDELKTKKSHITYTENEINILWQNAGTLIADMILIQCYSGWRPRELCNLKTENIDLDKGSMTGGMKTEAGTNREIPIHPKILPIIKRYYDQQEEYLFNDAGKPVNTDHLRYLFRRMVKKYNFDPNHRPHDGRVYFVTESKKCGVDEWAIKYIVGHVIYDITERVYTKRDFNWLKEEMKKLR